MSVLLDTSVVIALVSAARERDESAAVSVVTLGELHAGVLLARDGEARAMRSDPLRDVRATFTAIAVDQRVAERYGEVLAIARAERYGEVLAIARAERYGEVLAIARAERSIAKATDLLIIAGAAASGRTLLTLDIRQDVVASAAGVAASSEL